MSNTYFVYERVEKERGEGWCSTSSVSSSVSKPTTEEDVLERARALAVKSFDDELHNSDLFEFYENLLMDIAFVRCDKPHRCAMAVMKVMKLSTID